MARAAGSLGDADLVACRPAWEWGRGRAEVKLIEVKSTAAGPFHSFGPADRKALLEAAERAGGRAVLAYWPPRGTLRWIEPKDWPSTPS